MRKHWWAVYDKKHHTVAVFESRGEAAEFADECGYESVGRVFEPVIEDAPYSFCPHCRREIAT